MTLQELKEKAIALSADERFELISAIAKSFKQESDCSETWHYLAPRPESWRKQLYIKGKRLPAAVVRDSLIVEGMTIEETAYDWDLPIEAVRESIRYCEAHKELIEKEAEEERQYLEEHRGSVVGPEAINR